MTFTFLATKSSTIRTCCAGSAVVGPTMEALSPVSLPGFFDAFPHGGKPGNAADLHDHGHIVVGRARANE